MSENLVTVSQAQLAQLQGQLAELQSANAAAKAETEAARSREMIRAGQGDAVLRQHQAELVEARDRAGKFAATSELSRCLSAHALAPHAGPQLEALLRAELVVDPTPDGSYNVRTKDYRSCSEFVSSALANPSYSHFLATTPAPNVNRPATPGAPSAPAAQGTPASMPEPGADLSRGFGGFGPRSGSTPTLATLSHILRGGR